MQGNELFVSSLQGEMQGKSSFVLKEQGHSLYHPTRSRKHTGEMKENNKQVFKAGGEMKGKQVFAF